MLEKGAFNIENGRLTIENENGRLIIENENENENENRLCDRKVYLK